MANLTVKILSIEKKLIEKVLIKVYFENEFVGLEVFTDEKKFLRYVERYEYIDGKRNYIIQDTDKFKLLVSRVFFKKVLEYFKGVAKVKFQLIMKHQEILLRAEPDTITEAIPPPAIAPEVNLAAYFMSL